MKSIYDVTKYQQINMNTTSVKPTTRSKSQQSTIKPKQHSNQHDTNIMPTNRSRSAKNIRWNCGGKSPPTTSDPKSAKFDVEVAAFTNISRKYDVKSQFDRMLDHDFHGNP